MIAALQEAYDFFIYTSNEDLGKEVLPIDKTDEWIDFNKHTKIYYAGKTDRSQRLVDAIQVLRPDILYIVGLFDWHFNIVPMIYASAGQKIVSVRGMLHPGALKQKAIKKQLFLQAMRLYGLGKKCSFHATDAQEAGYVKNIMGDNAVVHTAGNFARSFAGGAAGIKLKNELSLISIGIVSPMKNYLLVLQSLLQVEAHTSYHIYGAIKDDLYWQDCQQLIKKMPEHIQVQYHGELQPDLIGVALQENDVFILPSESENFGHAMAEALSVGLPLITSDTVPWTGLEAASAGTNVARNATDLAGAIGFFAAMDEAEFAPWRAGAKAYIQSRIDKEGLREAYRKMFGGGE